MCNAAPPLRQCPDETFFGLSETTRREEILAEGIGLGFRTPRSFPVAKVYGSQTKSRNLHRAARDVGLRRMRRCAMRKKINRARHDARYSCRRGTYAVGTFLGTVPVGSSPPPVLPALLDRVRGSSRHFRGSPRFGRRFLNTGTVGIRVRVPVLVLVLGA